MLSARLLLGGMFAIAGLAKLADRGGARRAVMAFGAPRAAAGFMGSAGVAAELGIAVLLLVMPREGGAAALIALAAFSALALANLAPGSRAQCHCFGRLSSGPLGWATLARNACFAALAAFVALDGQFRWALTSFAAVMLALWLAPASRRRRNSRASSTPAGLALPDRTGRIWTLDELLEHRRPLVLIFSQPGCGACDALLPQVARWQGELDGVVTVALINGGPASHRVPIELIDESRASFAEYGIAATPSAVLIDAGRRADTARGAGAIGELVSRAAQAAERTTFTRRGLLRRASVGLLPVVGVAAAACHSGTKTAAVDRRGTPRGPSHLHPGRLPGGRRGPQSAQDAQGPAGADQLRQPTRSGRGAGRGRNPQPQKQKGWGRDRVLVLLRELRLLLRRLLLRLFLNSIAHPLAFFRPTCCPQTVLV